MKIKKSIQLGLASLLSLSSLLMAGIPFASAATVTWDGGGEDNRLNNALNWAGDVAPVAGDTLNFSFDSTKLVAVNDFTAGTTFASLNFSGTAEYKNFEINGNELGVSNAITISDPGATGNTVSFGAPVAMNGGVTITVLEDTGVYFNNTVSGAGNVIKNGLGLLILDKANTFTGSLAINGGEVIARDVNSFGTAAGATTIADGTSFHWNFNDTTPVTITEPLTLGGDGDGSGFGANALAFSCGMSGCSVPDITLSGDITLTANTVIVPSSKVTLTGALNGDFTLGVMSGAAGQLVINANPNNSKTPNSSIEAPVESTNYADSQPTVPVSVGKNQTAVITGERGDVNVSDGGVLKGTGKVDQVTINSGGKLAPGLSPGCIATGDLVLAEGSIYELEVGGTTACTEYDQTKVTGTVDVTGATLSAGPFNGFVPQAGQSYTVIDNDGTDAVTGTFKDIAEGGSYTNLGVTYSVTYVGGDGNDVVLTVTSVDASQLPASPDTGFTMVAAHPALAMGLTTLAALGLFGLSRRLNFAKR